MQIEVQDAVTIVEVAGGVPSTELVSELNRACDIAEDSPGSVLVLSIRGAAVPRLGEPDIHLFTQWERVVRRLERAPAVTVGAAHGICGWLETGVLLAVDYRVAHRDVRLSLLDGAGRVVPGMGIYRLATQIGIARSRRIALFGEQMSAGDALALGLLDQIIDDVASIPAILEKVSRLDGADLAVRRRLLLEAPNRSFEDALGTHLAARERSVRRAAESSGS